MKGLKNLLFYVVILVGEIFLLYTLTGTGEEELQYSQVVDYFHNIGSDKEAIKEFELEYHKRIATSFAAFILTLIGVSLSAKKVKGGMGLNLGIGIALSAGYIVFQTISATFAVNGSASPIVAVWIPNIVFLVIGIYLYWKAPK